MRNVAILVAAASAFISLYQGVAVTTSDSKDANPSVVSMDVWEAQVRAGRDLPVTVVDNPI
jgi:hypothetical protein